MNNPKISVVIIASNAGKTIAQVLDKLLTFNEVVMYVNNCSDKTIEIAMKYSNVNLIKGDFIGFGPTKNKATEYAKNDWILSLDSDEVLDELFIESVKKVSLNEKYIYYVIRHNYYKNQRIRFCGWKAEQIPRLYNRKVTSFNNKLVHEAIITTNLSKQILNGIVEHHSYFSASDFIKKMDNYSEIFANQNLTTKKSSPIKAILRALAHFIKIYIFKLGFLDGYRGLLITISGTNSVFYKYIKLYEKQQFKS